MEITCSSANGEGAGEWGILMGGLAQGVMGCGLKPWGSLACGDSQDDAGRLTPASARR